jgi:hypothetical protein
MGPVLQRKAAGCSDNPTVGQGICTLQPQSYTHIFLGIAQNWVPGFLVPVAPGIDGAEVEFLKRGKRM